MKSVWPTVVQRPATRPLTQNKARNLAAQLVEHKLDLVYGGGDVGLMKSHRR